MFQGNPAKHTELEKQLFDNYGNFFEQSPLPAHLKLSNFAKYTRRQDLSRFLAKNEIFKLQLDIPGSIVECGCFAGGGLMTYAQLSSIYEPYNHQRRIFGFDTFSGFPELHASDKSSESNWKEGDLKVHDEIVAEIKQSIELHDQNRALSHIPKTELIIGDATKTIPEFLISNPHIVVSFLYLDFDLYEPTKIALQNFIPRIPKGGIIAFDEINTKNFPGETLALLEVLEIKNITLRKTPFDPYISYSVI